MKLLDRLSSRRLDGVGDGHKASELTVYRSKHDGRALVTIATGGIGETFLCRTLSLHHGGIADRNAATRYGAS
jgi:hypothetical protein